MFFRGNQNEWTFIPQNGKDDIADFVHNSTQSRHLGLAFTLFFIEGSQYRILRSAVHTEADRLYRQNIDATSGVWGASLGHLQVGTAEISGLPDGWIKTKVCEKLLGPFECREVSYFADQRDSRKKANSRYALEQANLFCHLRVFLFLQKDFYLRQNLLRLGVQKTDHFYVVPDQIKNAGIPMAEILSVPSCFYQCLCFLSDVERAFGDDCFHEPLQFICPSRQDGVRSQILVQNCHGCNTVDLGKHRNKLRKNLPKQVF